MPRRLPALAVLAAAALAAAVPAAGQSGSHDAFDAATLGERVQGSTDATAPYDSAAYTTTARERGQEGEADYLGCLLDASTKVVGARSGWTRFSSAVAGTLRIEATTDHDVFLKLWKSARGHADAGTTPMTREFLVDHNCQDAVRGGPSEVLGGTRVAPGELFWVQTLPVCGRVPASTSWADACPGGDAAAQGGPTTLRLTFTADDRDADGVPDTRDACPDTAGGGADGCASAPTPAPSPAPGPTVVQSRVAIGFRTLPGRRRLVLTRFTVFASTGATIRVSCTRRACPPRTLVARGASRPVAVDAMVRRRIRNGRSWTVTVTKEGRIGVRRIYRVRRGVPVTPVIRCLAPGSTTRTVRCPED